MKTDVINEDILAASQQKIASSFFTLMVLTRHDKGRHVAGYRHAPFQLLINRVIHIKPKTKAMTIFKNIISSINANL